MEKQGWKTLAIVFICLFLLVVLVSVYLFSMGVSMINKENECALNCDVMYDAIAYQYDYPTEQCYCLDNNGEVVKRFRVE